MDSADVKIVAWYLKAQFAKTAYKHDHYISFCLAPVSEQNLIFPPCIAPITYFKIENVNSTHLKDEGLGVFPLQKQQERGGGVLALTF